MLIVRPKSKSIMDNSSRWNYIYTYSRTYQISKFLLSVAYNGRSSFSMATDRQNTLSGWWRDPVASVRAHQESNWRLHVGVFNRYCIRCNISWNICSFYQSWYLFYFAHNLITNCFIGNFTCLEVIFKFRRRLGYYLFHTYIPTCLIVMMSWISFWIKPEAVPARVTLGVTSLLTLSTQHANSQKSLPPVSYIKVNH